MRFLVRLVPKQGDGESFLRTVRTISRQLGMRAVNPKWTSYGALELDVFANSQRDIELLAATLEPLANPEFIRNLSEPRDFMPKDKLIELAREYFNAERYWECHEELESIWRVSEGGEKRLLQGLILVCASLVHHQKDELDVAVSISGRALRLLPDEQRDYFGIDIQALRSHTLEMTRGLFKPFSV
jgi:uncharacterized protein